MSLPTSDRFRAGLSHSKSRLHPTDFARAGFAGRSTTFGKASQRSTRSSHAYPGRLHDLTPGYRQLRSSLLNRNARPLLILKFGRLSWRSSEKILGHVKRLDETDILTVESNSRQGRRRNFHFFCQKMARRQCGPVVLVLGGLSAAAARIRKEGLRRNFNSRIVPGWREGE